MDSSGTSDGNSIQLRPRVSASSPVTPTHVSDPNPPVSQSLPTSPVKHASMGATPSNAFVRDGGSVNHAHTEDNQRPSVITNDVFIMESDHSSHQGIFEGAPFWDDNVSNSDVNIPRPFYAPPKHKGIFSGQKGGAIVLLLVIVLFLVGLIVGLALKSRCTKKIPVVMITRWHGYSPKLSRSMQANVTPDEMKLDMELFSRDVHQAGSKNNFNLAEKLYAAWSHFKFDELFFDNYTVQLSLADPTVPNIVAVYSATDELVVNATSTTDAVGGNFPYNAYSPNGSVKAEYVFVNYGSVSDLKLLQDRKISLDGRIAIARLGSGYRAGIASRVAKANATGLIVYADPADFAYNSSQIFPKGWLLPGDAPVFGNMRVRGGGGDPLTPDLPAVDGILRTEDSRIHFSPIPVQSVGYNDAKKLLDLLKVNEVPVGWNKTLAKFIGPSGDKKVLLTSRNQLVNKQIRNVVAVIRGDTEPDRVVVLGNHYDAWLYGASDPLSGTVIVHQVSKLFVKALDHAYRPQRTLVFVAWDAEEFGTIGSTEFTERLAIKLSAQAVSYINLDCPIKGDYSFYARSSPLLREVILKAAESVHMPNSSETVLSYWTKKIPENGGPALPLLGGGSDQTSFLFKLGVPSVYPQYIYRDWLPNMPAYHTKYDSYAMMAKVLDPDFAHHGIVARVVIDLLLRLVDSTILPFSIKEYPSLMRQYAEKLRKDSNKYKPLVDKEINLDYLFAAINDLEEASKTFTTGLAKLKSSDILALRRANDVLMQVPRSFLWPEGLPTRSYYKNILLSPTLTNSYSGSFLSGLVDGLYIGKRDGNWNYARRHFSILLNAIRGTTLLLNGQFYQGSNPRNVASHSTNYAPNTP